MLRGCACMRRGGGEWLVGLVGLEGLVPGSVPQPFGGWMGRGWGSVAPAVAFAAVVGLPSPPTQSQATVHALRVARQFQ